MFIRGSVGFVVERNNAVFVLEIPLPSGLSRRESSLGRVI